jgi:hypothetical protein
LVLSLRLASAGMSVASIVSLRFYVAEPALDPTNVAILKRRLGNHQSARIM